MRGMFGLLRSRSDSASDGHRHSTARACCGVVTLSPSWVRYPIIDLIGATTTSTGLKVYARLDPGHYEKGIKVTDQELAAVNIARDQFHPDWNYTIHPTQKEPLILS